MHALGGSDVGADMQADCFAAAVVVAARDLQAASPQHICTRRSPYSKLTYAMGVLDPPLSPAW